MDPSNSGSPSDISAESTPLDVGTGSSLGASSGSSDGSGSDQDQDGKQASTSSSSLTNSDSTGSNGNSDSNDNDSNSDSGSNGECFEPFRYGRTGREFHIPHSQTNKCMPLVKSSNFAGEAGDHELGGLMSSEMLDRRDAGIADEVGAKVKSRAAAVV